MNQTFELLRQEADPVTFPERLLRSIGVRYRITPEDRRRLPASGPALIVANHPFGIVETAAMAAEFRRIRPDIRFLANDLVAVVPELRDIIVPVSLQPGSARANAAAIRRAVEFLEGGGLLVVFPAGAVSHFQWRTMAAVDPEWSPAVVRIIELAVRAGMPPVAIPVYIPGSNSATFHAAGVLHPKLRTALLAHEFFNKQGQELELRIGRPISAAKLFEIPSDLDRVRYLRGRTYLLAERERDLRQNERSMSAIIPAVPADALAAEIAGLPPNSILDRAGDLSVYLCEAEKMPLLLREIGRLREMTFRAEGEGTGHRLDLDRFDWYYRHLFVWNARTREVVGAYRLQTAHDADSLYTRTLFQFDQRFLNAMGPAIELGRSFVRPEYQRSFAALLLLWKGIGKFIAANPRYKTLFGPVSISNRYQSTSRELMIACLEREAGLDDWKDLVHARNAPARRGELPVDCRDVDELSEAIADLEPDRQGIPVLLRQYLRLGGRLLGFSVDRKFSNALDGLILVNLTQTEPKLLERYLGKAEATAFLGFHATVQICPVSADNRICASVHSS